MKGLKSISAVVVMAGLGAMTAAAAQDEKFTVGVTIGDIGHPFHIRVWKTLQERADELGLDLVILDDKRDLVTEASMSTELGN